MIDRDESVLGSTRPTSKPPEDEATGLPWPQSWRGVYGFVLGVFVLWVTLLTVLTQSYS